MEAATHVVFHEVGVPFRMVILLLALAFAVAITVAGLLLSPRRPAPTYRGDIFYAEQADARRSNVRRNRSNSASVGEGRRMNSRRSQAVVEQRMWSNILASLNISQLFERQKKRRETPWLGVTLILIALFVFGFYLLRTVLPTPALLALMPDASNTSLSQTTSRSNSKPTQVFTGASKALVRISQVDPAQYASMQDYNTWWPSACSAASMTEVINSYGHNYRVTDILKAEIGVGEITPDAGLLYTYGLDKTLAQFHFTTHWLSDPLVRPAHPSVDNLIAVANSGTPVIINFPPDRWTGGHLLVVIGGNKDYVYLADSSRLNMRAMDRKTFLKYWVGFAVVATPTP